MKTKRANAQPSNSPDFYATVPIHSQPEVEREAWPLGIYHCLDLLPVRLLIYCSMMQAFPDSPFIILEVYLYAASLWFILMVYGHLKDKPIPGYDHIPF